MTKHKIGAVEEFPEGEGTKVNVDGIEIAVFNLDGDLHGIQNSCPHKRLPLHLTGKPRRTSDARGDDPAIRGEIDYKDCSISCPWHLMEFDLKSGRNDATGMHIATYDVEIDGEDVLIEI